eukprot:COSAG02_NODE_745_length_17738_cov_18.178241_11_plen_36_part_00
MELKCVNLSYNIKLYTGLHGALCDYRVRRGDIAMS